MKNLKEKSLKAVVKVQNAIACERGDTNFISILIILAIVIILAGIFIAFKDQIVTKVTGVVNQFTTNTDFTYSTEMPTTT